MPMLLTSLSEAGRVFFGNDFSNHLNSILGEYFRIKNSMSVHNDTLYELRETNNSLLSTKQNEVMKVLTIMAFVTFPLSLIASIFGMNTKNIPIVGGAFDFWIVMGIMGFAAFMMFIFFKKRNWL